MNKKKAHIMGKNEPTAKNQLMMIRINILSNLSIKRNNLKVEIRQQLQKQGTKSK